MRLILVESSALGSDSTNEGTSLSTRLSAGPRMCSQLLVTGGATFLSKRLVSSLVEVQTILELIDHSHRISQRLGFQLLHCWTAMNLHGIFSSSELTGDLPMRFSWRNAAGCSREESARSFGRALRRKGNGQSITVLETQLARVFEATGSSRHFRCVRLSPFGAAGVKFRGVSFWQSA